MSQVGTGVVLALACKSTSHLYLLLPMPMYWFAFPDLKATILSIDTSWLPVIESSTPSVWWQTGTQDVLAGPWSFTKGIRKLLI